MTNEATLRAVIEDAEGLLSVLPVDKVTISFGGDSGNPLVDVSDAGFARDET